MAKIQVTPEIALDENELRLDFVQASGPGGQNVNKVATAVQLRFDAVNSPNLADDVRARLLKQAGRRRTTDGVIVIEAKRFRSQERNRQDAIEQLSRLIRQAAKRPKLRRKTKPTAASRERRLSAKKRRSEAKSRRRPVGYGGDE